MSAETQAVLDAAIAAHVADGFGEGDRIVTGYVVMVASVNGEDVTAGRTGYSTLFPENQPAHVGDGLALRLMRELDAAQFEDE